MPPEALASPNPGGFLVLALALPVAGILLVLLAGGRYARGITLALLVAGVVIAAVIAGGVWRTGDALTYLSGGWAPPLGIKLRADGLSAAMIVVTSIVILAAGLYAPHGVLRAARKARNPRLALLLDPAALGLGGDERGLPGQRPFQSLCRTGARHLRRRAVGLPEWQPRDIDRRVALPAVCLDWFGALPAWSRLALWQLRHARHRRAGCAGSPRAGAVAHDFVDDCGARGKDRLVPGSHVASPGSFRCAARGQRLALGSRGQGLVLSDRSVVV